MCVYDIRDGEIIFLDEKINLDHPDELPYCWPNIRNERHINMSLQVDGGSVMIWGTFSCHRKSEFSILSRRPKQSGLLFSFGALFGIIHRLLRTETQLYFISTGQCVNKHCSSPRRLDRLRLHIRSIPWPARFLYLNPIEKIRRLVVTNL